MSNLRTAAQQPLYGWVFKRNADGSIGIFAPPPRPGESQRTSDCIGPGQRDLHELLGKLADHMAAGAAAERKKSQSRISEEELEALLKWKEEGDQISTKAGLFTLFHLGGWWADRPWRKK